MSTFIEYFKISNFYVAKAVNVYTKVLGIGNEQALPGMQERQPHHLSEFMHAYSLYPI